MLSPVAKETVLNMSRKTDQKMVEVLKKKNRGIVALFISDVIYNSQVSSLHSVLMKHTLGKQASRVTNVET